MSDTSRSTPSVADPLAAQAGTTVAYTDGACKGNPGAGGWGAHLIFSDGQTQDLYGGEPDTTNNRMELMGAIKALTHSPQDMTLAIWTDSSYVQKGITEWIAGWKKRGWKTASKKPVANQDLWQQLDALCQNRDVEWHWVKGHAGHAGNEKADTLANLGVTGSSDHADFEPCAADDSAAKKKADHAAELSTSNVNTSSSTHTDNHTLDEDWLTSDPLGFNMMTETLNDANVEAETIMDTPVHNDAVPVSAATIPETETVKFDGDTSRANPHFRPLLPKPVHRQENSRQLIMDTETTGLDALKGDRVIEVGIVEMVGRKFTGEKLHVYINPQRGMDEEVIRIHGISEAFLADKPTFDQVAQSLYDFMDGAEIIAHNASFDMTFLSMEFDKVGLQGFAQRVQVTDSLAMAKQLYPGQKNTLDALVRRLNVGKQDRTFHGALLDSEILAEVYLAMTGGQVALAIEEDNHSDNGQATHSNFAALAELLLTSPTSDRAHQDWFASLATDYPEMKTALSQW